MFFVNEAEAGFTENPRQYKLLLGNKSRIKYIWESDG